MLIADAKRATPIFHDKSVDRDGPIAILALARGPIGIITRALRNTPHSHRSIGGATIRGEIPAAAIALTSRLNFMPRGRAVLAASQAQTAFARQVNP